MHIAQPIILMIRQIRQIQFYYYSNTNITNYNNRYYEYNAMPV